ncbi:MAG: alpha/beta fold hydrolase [Gammaproteobacteria bacterium]|jgi:homoserine O-acetyltransferase|nr:alpha/beta fold hydrolase [Gammaproteobacteria bacterium]
MTAISDSFDAVGRIGRFSYVLPAGPGPGRNGTLVYATWGRLNERGDNAVLLPSYYTGTHVHYAPLIGRGRALDPARHFIVAPNMFGNGVSTSPSHLENPRLFPRLTIEDHVHAQHALLASLGVRKLALAAGWSMGAMQALHWAMLYPDSVRNVVAVCGTAFCWPVNTAFLSGIAPVLEIAPKIDEALALDLFGRVYAGWAYSAEFFRGGLYRQMGFNDIQGLLDDWGRSHQGHRAADLLAVLRVWADTARSPDAARAALGQIKARCWIMPCDTDRYFTVDDARFEAAALACAEIHVLRSPFGHCAGAPGRFEGETAQIEAALAGALAHGPA